MTASFRVIKRIKSYASLALICLLLFTLLCSCSPTQKSPKSRIFYEYFDTVGTFYDYTGADDCDFSALADEVEELLCEYHRLYDIYNEYEGLVNLATLNRTAGGGAVKVDEKIVDMLLFAKDAYLLTDGNVNVAMGAVLEIWHEYREEGTRLPEASLLASAAAHTDISSVIIDEENLTVEITDPALSLDVGAIAKGYAVEMIARELEGRGLCGYVLDVGGNLRAVGTKPSGDGWRTGIRNPDTSSDEAYVYEFELKNGAVVTSGSYERFYTVGGVRYHHIINGKTLMPANYYTSVSVISSSSALSDALSTALFNMEYADAADLVNSLNNVKVIFVMQNGEVRTLGSYA